ncbi:MAG: hypothetical protein IT233_00800 [Bacteroidia bacterium]|nr:hypothetical protein [Bacteroidia bacterium]
MKQPSDELFQLIKALDRHEKRFFKMYASRRKEDSQHVRLFEAMDQLDIYNERELLKNLGDSDLEKTIKYAKRDLFRVVMTSLEYYHEEDSVKNRLAKKLHQIRILADKNLMGPATRILAEAKSLATENELYPHLFEILAMESLLYRRKEEVGKWQEMIRSGPAIYDELLDKYRDQLRFQTYEMEVTYHLSTGEYQANQEHHRRLEELLQIITSTPPAFRDKHTELDYHKMCFLLNAMLRNWEVAYSFQKKFIELYEQQPELNEMASQYLTHLYNYALTCVFFKNFTEVVKTWDKAKAFEEILPTKLNTRAVQERLLTIQIAVVAALSTSCLFDDAIRMAQEISESPHFKLLGTPIKKSLIFTLGSANFITANYKESLSWINKIVNAPEFSAEIRQDIDLSAVILNILIHYELGNFDLAESLVKSALRVSAKKEDENKLFRYFLKFFGDMILKKSPDKPDAAEFEKFKVEVMKLREQDFKARYILEDMDLITWAESKQIGTPFVDQLKDNFNRQKAEPVG